MAASAEEWSGQWALKLIPVQPVKAAGMQWRFIQEAPWLIWELSEGRRGRHWVRGFREANCTHTYCTRTNTHTWISTHTNMQALNSTCKPSSHWNLVCVLLASAKCRVLIVCVCLRAPGPQCLISPLEDWNISSRNSQFFSLQKKHSWFFPKRDTVVFSRRRTLSSPRHTGQS